jgi:hypothetical protein
MNISHLFLPFLFWGLFTFGLSLSGCSSGGSSSGGSDDPPTNNPDLYQGRTEPVLITEDTAIVAAQMFVDSLYFLEPLHPLWLPMWEFSEIPEEIEETVMVGAGEINMKVMPTQQDITLILKFKNAMEDGVTINGEVRQKQSRETLSSLPFGNNYIYGDMTVTDLHVRSQEIDVSISGSIRFNHGNGSWLIDAVTRDITTGKVVKLQNFTETRARDGSAIIQKFQGALYHSDLGKLTVATENAFVDLREDEIPNEEPPFLHAREGRIMLSGDNNLELAVINDAYVSLLLTDASQENGSKGQLREWRELSEYAPILGPESRPKVGAVVTGVFPNQVGHPVKIHGLLSTTREQDFINYQWQRVYAPAGSEAPETVKGPFLNVTPDIPGDYIYDLLIEHNQEQDRERVEFFAWESYSEQTYYLSSIQPNAVVVDTSSDGTSFEVFFASTIQTADFAIPPDDWNIEDSSIYPPDISVTTLAPFAAMVQSTTPLIGQYQIRGTREGSPSSYVAAPLYTKGYRFSAIDLAGVRLSTPFGEDNIHSAAHYFEGDELHLIYPVYDNGTLTINYSIPSKGANKSLGSIPPHHIYSWFQKDKNSYPQLVAEVSENSIDFFGFSIFNITADGLIDASTPSVALACETPINFLSFTMANVVGDSELELITNHECHNAIYYWQKNDSGNYVDPQVLYASEDSDSQLGVVAAAPQWQDEYDDLIIKIGDLYHLYNDGEPIALETNGLPRIFQIFSVPSAGSRNLLFALYFNSNEESVYIRQIHKANGEVSFDAPIFLPNQESLPSPPITSSVSARYDDNSFEDLLLVTHDRIIIVSDYTLTPVVKSYEVSNDFIRGNMAISLMDLNGDGAKEMIVGGTAYLATPAL